VTVVTTVFLCPESKQVIETKMVVSFFSLTRTDSINIEFQAIFSTTNYRNSMSSLQNNARNKLQKNNLLGHLPDPAGSVIIFFQGSDQDPLLCSRRLEETSVPDPDP
jgi:hypothetical protein